MTITGTPARHGPVGIEPINGEVTWFVLSIEGSKAIYLSGDTVWYPGIAEIAGRFDVGLAVLFTGAGQLRVPYNVTMNANDALEAATVFPQAKIIAIHNYGWSHYTQTQGDIANTFAVVGLGEQVISLTPMLPVTLQVRKWALSRNVKGWFKIATGISGTPA